MSYLNPLRLHFSGSFQADVSTVNNDPAHFDNATFKPEYQQRATPGHPHGWWNPRGSGDWRLRGCSVNAAFLGDGTPVSADDQALGAVVADSAGTAPAKLVDLDSEQQLVSAIWGLTVRIVTPGRDTLLSGQFEAAAFTDIWARSTDPTVRGDAQAAAMFQSVITSLQWGAAARSPFLRELRETADAGMLSIKFNVDTFNTNYQDPRFVTGRIVGTIGPAFDGEPRHFVGGRQFMAEEKPTKGFFQPAGQLNFCAGVLDPGTRRVYLDLGNALPTGSGGALSDLGDLSLSVPSADGTQSLELGVLPARAYTHPAWYDETAGVAVFPPDRPLSDLEIARVDSGALALTGRAAEAGRPTEIREAPGGLFVRADEFVFRLSPGDQQDVRLYATRFGHPYSGAEVLTFPTPQFLQPAQSLQPTQSLQPAQGLGVAEPSAAIRFDKLIVTDADGRANLHIEAGNPGTPRRYIDGQVYALYPALRETLEQRDRYPFDPANFISLLVWSAFQPDEPPTWHGCIGAILTQYANLYPLMGDFVDLGDYDSVGKRAETLRFALRAGITDPNSMPVTRDLSPAKRAAILRWLSTPGADGLPLLGTKTTPAIPLMRVPTTDERAPSGVLAALAADGGKAAAVNRRPAAGHRSADVVLASVRTAQTTKEN